MILSSPLLSVSQIHSILSLLSALAYAWDALAVRFKGPAAPKRLGLPIAWLLHAMVLGWSVWSGVGHFGFAPALSITVWLVIASYYLESKLYPALLENWGLSALGAGVVLLAWLFPGGALHHTASFWMPLHLSLAVACYGLFGTAVLHGWLIQRAEKRMRQASNLPTGLPLLALERLTYRFVGVGFGLLSATLVVGMLFGEIVYGHAWRWDHKNVFSLLAWLTFAILLAGRAQFGWRGKRALRFLYIGCVLLLLAYVGSRFVMEIILGRAK